MNVAIDVAIGPTGEDEVPLFSPFGDANAADDVRHSGLPRGPRPQDVGVKQKSLHQPRRVGLELLHQSWGNAEDVARTPGGETADWNA
jgi:hypothetical protein